LSNELRDFRTNFVNFKSELPSKLMIFFENNEVRLKKLTKFKEVETVIFKLVGIEEPMVPVFSELVNIDL
jgi:hypothetical protein